MFEKITEGAIKVIMLSQEEARQMGHNFVGTRTFIRCYWTKTWNWSESFKETKLH
jgi:hypothetical protein